MWAGHIPIERASVYSIADFFFPLGFLCVSLLFFLCDVMRVQLLIGNNPLVYLNKGEDAAADRWATMLRPCPAPWKVPSPFLALFVRF
jgi:hypothetical protein